MTEYIFLSGSPFAKIESGSVYYYHNDHLGTPQKMTDALGAVVWEGEFTPFGEAISIAGTITNNLRFPGQYYDAETRLHQNWNRNYNPVIGRYSEVDPMKSKFMFKGKYYFVVQLFTFRPDKLSSYAYALNNPLMQIDPDGLRPQVPGCDLVPDSWETRCVRLCCDDHDRCFARRNCNMWTSWPVNLCTSFITPCSVCNTVVMNCIATCALR